jgi:hypothetical protein
MNRRELTKMSSGDWYIKEYNLDDKLLKIETNDCYTQYFEYENNICIRAWYDGFSNQKIRDKNRNKYQ